ncbi:MAG TPA: alpha/beta hydrolase-fold protein [Vicinamibacterales bacterium]|nr:alpha/beta hydrolase-fold protein [Vicinamibacterales bacterium]
MAVSSLERVTIPNSYAPTRPITVYLPAGHDPKVPAPLLILHDGQNLFEPERAHVRGQHWQVAETADALVAAGAIPPIVIAGIDHAEEERGREMTPTPGDHAGAGGAGIYGRFVMGEVVPHLAREFGVRTDRDGIAMGGASLGGLVTLAIARQFPGRIGRLLLMSPSVWWDNRVILRRLERVGLGGRPRVWLDIGRREGAQTVTDTRLLRNVLLWQSSALKYVEDPEGRHSEIDWARRLPEALTYLYA